MRPNDFGNYNYRSCISIHAPRERCDISGFGAKRNSLLFQSTHPVRGATVVPFLVCFIYNVFQSTHPVRGATATSSSAISTKAFQSTHPVRGATQTQNLGKTTVSISIHAPRERCDNYNWETEWAVDISIHAPRERCDSGSLMICMAAGLFQSTHPVRGATVKSAKFYTFRIFQSTHPVRGATGFPAQLQQLLCISIHAPRERCDYHGISCVTARIISIHAPRERCDWLCGRCQCPIHTFQSTHPVRGATGQYEKGKRPYLFQSTHPVRGATSLMLRTSLMSVISIHAPRERCDGSAKA